MSRDFGDARRLDPAEFEGKFEKWIDYITTHHHGSDGRRVASHPFQPLHKPLAESRVALVGSAGVHLDDQEPFHVETLAGDSSLRLIPDDVDTGRLRFTHTHYDTASAEKDPNVVFPLDRLHEVVEEGRIGSTCSVHIGLMGFNPDPTAIADDTAPEIVDQLVSQDVDVVLLVPG
jgi:D-proline reductase (dithiol) PrdB